MEVRTVEKQIQYSVFTKPWRTMPLRELAIKVQQFGFDGIELPVRPGFQVEPENAERDLLAASALMAVYGVKILSVAGSTDERTISACAAAGVPLLRTMIAIGPEGYLASIANTQRLFDGLLPALERHHVTLGVQNHCSRFVQNAMGLKHLLEPFNPKYIAAVWDAAHNALNGEEPELALDIIWDKLALVNLKNAFWQRSNGPEAEYAIWQPYWTSGPQGLANWPRVVAELRRRAYQGVICLTAEYSDDSATDRLIASDLLFAKKLFSQELDHGQ
jgi:sugar phosphate isomerase/epimerase